MPEVVLLLTLKGNLKEMITIIIVIRVKQSLEKWYIYLKKKKKFFFTKTLRLACSSHIAETSTVYPPACGYYSRG